MIICLNYKIKVAYLLFASEISSFKFCLFQTAYFEKVYKQINNFNKQFQITSSECLDETDYRIIF